MDLAKLREEIDCIDRQIVELYEQRMEVAGKVAEYKLETGKKVFDRVREQEKLQKVRSLTRKEENSQGIEELFEQIMSMSRKLQYRILAQKGVTGRLPFIGIDGLDRNARVVFPGAQGAYTQAAMEEYFGKDVDSIHVDSFRDAMMALDEGSADYAVLPIENSTAGIVNEIYDLLVEFENYIVAEQIIRIEHCLLALPGTKLEEIKTVYSHPQSLMQSSRYLEEHPEWQQISMGNNAFAARKVAQEGDRTQAAIAGVHAAQTYGLEVLEKGVNKSNINSTRFIVVTNQKVFLKDAKKVSICFEIPHESGSLYRMLSHFIFNNLNLNKIESRPIEDRNWEYRFFIDFDGNLADSAVRNALRGLRDEARYLKVLGNY
ncbi:MAG: prephenate dehydratase [Lachnospiraceae bacterium]|nr:prephenate dehydratase [Lachnospiraceae bacterium]